MNTCLSLHNSITPNVFARSQIGRSLLYTAESYKQLERGLSDTVDVDSEKLAQIASPDLGKVERAWEPAPLTQSEPAASIPSTPQRREINGYFLAEDGPSGRRGPATEAARRRKESWSLMDAEKESTTAHIYQSKQAALAVIADLRTQTRTKATQSSNDHFKGFMAFLQS